MTDESRPVRDKRVADLAAAAALARRMAGLPEDQRRLLADLLSATVDAAPSPGVWDSPGVGDSQVVGDSTRGRGTAVGSDTGGIRTGPTANPDPKGSEQLLDLTDEGRRQADNASTT